MRKLKRRKVVKEFLEEQIAKNQRRIQTISETNYKLRKQLDVLNALPTNKPLTKADLEAKNKAIEEAEKAAAEPVMDNADQEIGATSIEEKI